MLIARIRRIGLLEVARYALRLGAVAVRRPTEAADHLGMQVALTRSPPPKPIAAVEAWRRALHERLGVPWPCQAHAEFEHLWSGLAAEPVPSAVDHDADPTLAEMVWCIVRHARPRAVVETGVSRGITSSVILEALARNEHGRLWSVDLPPLEEPWRSLVATAVPATRRERWTYVRGSSRRRLPALCRRVGLIDLFVHDSLHTPDNLRFELATVWPHLRAGALVVIDDAEECRATELVPEFTAVPLLAARADRKRGTVGFVEKGL